MMPLILLAPASSRLGRELVSFERRLANTRALEDAQCFANISTLGAFSEVLFGTQRRDLLGHRDVNQLVDGDAL